LAVNIDVQDIQFYKSPHCRIHQRISQIHLYNLTVISALKKSELDNSIVARFYSLDKTEIEDSITSFLKVNHASETNLIEDYVSPLKTSNNVINMKFMPFSINTLKFI